MLELHGKQGKSVVVEGANVRIIKAGGMFAATREKTLPIRNITSVEVKKPGSFIAGFLQFSIAGGISRDSSYTMTGGAYSAAQDENSIVFNDQESYEIAITIKEYIQSYYDSSDTSKVKATGSVADEIRKLKSLFDEGILTEEEFNKKKQQLLGI